MPDPNATAGATAPDSQDPYAAMLGENVGGIKGYARRYLALQSGSALHAADERQRMRIAEGQRAHDEAANAAKYGMDEFFTPERVKYAKSLGVDLGGLQSIAAQRKKLMADDEAQMVSGGQSSPPATGAAPSATTPGASPAPAGGGVQPASTGPMPPLNADDGQPNWHGHDWAAHAQSEPPEEKAAYDKGVFYMNKARHAEMFGLPTSKAYHDMAAFYGKQYHDMLTKRMGFESSSALETQRAKDALERAKVGHEQTGKAAIENRNASLHERVDTQAATYASKGFGSEGEAQAAADLLNAQRRRANQHGEENKIDPVNQFFQVKKATNNKLFPDAYTIEPTDTDPSSKKADGGTEAATAPASAAPAPKKIKSNLSDLEGHVIPGPPGKPDLIIRNGKPEVYTPETNARR